MAYLDWKLKGKRLIDCSCDYGCPCEFNGQPTAGFCEGLEAMEIDEGYFGEVRLDGLRFAGTYRWPGPVHEGKGSYQVVIDERITDEQRDAMFSILSGEEQEPTTVFNIYGSTMETEYDPIFAPIEFEWDKEARTGRVSVPNVLEARFEPIRNPVTGKPHHARIVLPEGFEFREAEMASSDFTSPGPIPLEYKQRYGSLFYVAYGPYGIIND
jgi:hypothetical protein